jgi:hypothetical protein
MYLWKYWRESRIAFSVALLVIIGAFLNTFRERIHSAPDVRQLSTLLALLLYFQMVPLSFLGWLMGSIGAGRDLGEKNGSFLFTRPRPRGYFVWCDWACGLVQLLPLVMLSNFVVWFQVHRLLLMTGDPLHGRIPLIDGTTPSLAVIVGLSCIIVFLLVALVFSLTYFSTVAFKHARGIIFAAGVLIAYPILAMRIKHYWPAIHMPGLFLQQFTFARGQVYSFTDHLGLSMAIRAGVVLLLPFAAQLVLEKTDI